MGRITQNFGKDWNFFERHFGTDSTFEVFLNLQLVCKDWHKATQATFSGCLALDSKKNGPAKLAQICERLLTTSELDIISWPNEPFNGLYPISNCSGLSSLILNHSGQILEGEAPVSLDLAVLPAGLKSLEASLYRIDMASAEHITCVGLTRLSLGSMTNTFPEMRKLLPRFEDLKVKFYSTINHFQSRPFP